MDETQLIELIQSHLSSRLSAPVRTSAMDDERPVPVIIIEDWDTRDFNFHNSAFAGDAVGDFSGDGELEYERYLNFDFSTRVEFLVRHSDEVAVSRLKESVKQELRLIRENPMLFHEELKECELSADGNPTNRFTEPKESELMVSARFHGDHTIVRTLDDMQEDALEDVKNSFAFNP